MYICLPISTYLETLDSPIPTLYKLTWWVSVTGWNCGPEPSARNGSCSPAARTHSGWWMRAVEFNPACCFAFRLHHRRQNNSGESWATPSPTPQVPSISWTVECRGYVAPGLEESKPWTGSKWNSEKNLKAQTPTPEKGDQGGTAGHGRVRTHCLWRSLKAVAILFRHMKHKMKQPGYRGKGDSLVQGAESQGQGLFLAQLGVGSRWRHPFRSLHLLALISWAGSFYKQMPFFCW